MKDGRSVFAPVTLVDQLGAIHGVIAGHEILVIRETQVTLGDADKLIGTGIVLEALDFKTG